MKIKNSTNCSLLEWVRDPYGMLGVERGASKDDIKKAFRKTAKINHPDVGGSEDAMKIVNKAEAQLTNDTARNEAEIEMKRGVSAEDDGWKRQEDGKLVNKNEIALLDEPNDNDGDESPDLIRRYFNHGEAEEAGNEFGKWLSTLPTNKNDGENLLNTFKNVFCYGDKMAGLTRFVMALGFDNLNKSNEFIDVLANRTEEFIKAVDNDKIKFQNIYNAYVKDNLKKDSDLRELALDTSSNKNDKDRYSDMGAEDAAKEIINTVGEDNVEKVLKNDVLLKTLRDIKNKSKNANNNK